jgi:uncharacterized membrane protein YfcA
MLSLSLLCVFAFCAGLFDAAVGGGGLIQIPALFNFLPSYPAVALFGTNKLAGACGTAFAAKSYLGRVKVPWLLVLPAVASAFAMSFLGAATVGAVPQRLIRPVVLALIIAMAIYTFVRKDFGAMQGERVHRPRDRATAMLIGGAIGFYDGMFGPGTGSFLMFLFVRVFAFNFLQASACAKLVNLATNIAALAFFIPTGNVLYQFALPMAACNIAGALVGSRLALRYGTRFVRKLFLLMLLFLIAKLTYDTILRA